MTVDGQSALRRLQPLDPDRFEAQVNHVDVGGGLQLFAVTWGGPVELEFDPLRDRYLVTVPTQGQIEMRCGSQRFVADETTAAVLNPHVDSWQRWSSDSEALWVHLNRRTVEAAAQHHAGRQRASRRPRPRRPVRLDAVFDLADGPGKSWHETLWHLIRYYDDHDPAFARAHPPEALRRQLITGLLTARHPA